MKEIDTQEKLVEILQKSVIQNVAFQALDLRNESSLLRKTVVDCLFLGCNFTSIQLDHLNDRNYIFPELEVPYHIYPHDLYNSHSLYGNVTDTQQEEYKHCYDQITYQHYIATGKKSLHIKETLARRLHDHSITNALDNFLSNYKDEKIVAIMGGHGLSRMDNDYKKVVLISKQLTESGYMLLSGGGPGAMEATHLGAWMAKRSIVEVEQAISILSKAEKYDHPNWLKTAFEVIEAYPRVDDKICSVGIPTWLYGHEPATPFATHIAKYFANSVREDGLLALAKGGVIFAPGSAGTMQEIFQDICQNHYISHEYSSPMVFLNEKYWTNSRPIYPLLQSMTENEILKNLLLSISDDVDHVIQVIQDFR